MNMKSAEKEDRARKKILYVAGWGRSGTTVLDNLLGQCKGFVSTGELHYVWERGLLQGRDCGCGRPLMECPEWVAAFEAGFEGIEAVDPKSVVDAQAEIHTRHARRILRAVREERLTGSVRYAGFLRQMYDGIASARNARVIVDSSKYPTDAIVAAGLSGYEVHVVHMVRDPRAVAFSWQRLKPAKDKKINGGMLARVGLVRSTLVWQIYNAVIQRYVRAAVGDDHYMVLHYEQLVADPQRVVHDLIQFVAEDPGVMPRFVGNEVEMSATHTASGNPGRFRTGRTQIRLDSEWSSAMPRWQRMAVTALSFPMVLRMGYAGRLPA